MWPFKRKIKEVLPTVTEIELRQRISKLMIAVHRTRYDRDRWKKKFEEMESRWRFAKEQKEKWRHEKNRLLKLLNNGQEDAVSDTTKPLS